MEIEQRPSIVFVHGWWGGPWVWERFESFFSMNGYDCHLLDLRGLGSFQCQLEALEQVTSKLERPFIIGHSAGGLLVQKLLETTTVSGAVLLASAAPRGILAVRSWRLLMCLIKYSLRVLIDRRLLLTRADMYALNLNRLDANEQQEVYDRMVPIADKEVWQVALAGVQVDVRRVTSPLLVVNGSDDRLTPPSLARRIADKYDAEYREYEGKGHYLMWEPKWQEIATSIDAWIRQCSPHYRNSDESLPELRHDLA